MNRQILISRKITLFYYFFILQSLFSRGDDACRTHSSSFHSAQINWLCILRRFSGIHVRDTHRIHLGSIRPCIFLMQEKIAVLAILVKYRVSSFILFYFRLFYFILDYFNLFYFILGFLSYFVCLFNLQLLRDDRKRNFLFILHSTKSRSNTNNYRINNHKFSINIFLGLLAQNQWN